MCHLVTTDDAKMRNQTPALKETWKNGRISENRAETPCQKEAPHGRCGHESHGHNMRKKTVIHRSSPLHMTPPTQWTRRAWLDHPCDTGRQMSLHATRCIHDQSTPQPCQKNILFKMAMRFSTCAGIRNTNM